MRSIRGLGEAFWYEFVLEIPSVRRAVDQRCLRVLYQEVVGRPLRLSPPITLGEKITWRMLYQYRPLFSRVADKYLVRSYVADLIGAQYLPKLYAAAARFHDIPLATLPVPFILKTNHGCGGYIVVRDLQELDVEAADRSIEESLKRNYYRAYREYHYKRITPMVIAEELLADAQGNLPADYKFYMFHGRFGFLHVDLNRRSDHRRAYFDERLIPLPVEGRVALPVEAIQLPANTDEMVVIAERLSHDFDFVRVDLYDVDGRIVFGELTLTPQAGRLIFEPDDYDERFGRLWRLPS